MLRCRPTPRPPSWTAPALEGWARRHDGALAGWSLTPAGREHVEELLAAEVDRLGVRPSLERAYVRFEVLNGEALAVCSAWQVRVVDGAQVVNDHSDMRHDRGVLARLGVVDRAAQALVHEMASALERFDAYGRRLRHARRRIVAGEVEWFTRPSIDSYHTVWFEWHEDLLATLGRRRGDGPAASGELTSTWETA